MTNVSIHKANGEFVGSLTVRAHKPAHSELPDDVYRHDAFKLADTLWKTLPYTTIKYALQILNARSEMHEQEMNSTS